MITICATIPVNYSARHSELTYERHIFLPASPAEEKSAKLHTQTVQNRKEETAAYIKTIQNKNQRGE